MLTSVLKKQKKKLAKPYSKAIMAMLPRTSYDDGVSKPVHEPINDVHVHGHTMQQVFLPVSESRHFTREDAAKAFNRKMLSADDRSQHPELVSMMRGVLGGERRGDSTKKFVEAARESEQALVRKAEAAQQREAARTTNVQSDRFEFRIQAFNSERVGILGRDRHATGWRYGAPLDDRKRGKVRIPTSVP
ncbi:hypothetical protein IMZ48_35185 [Candidatus Bathyarchaeota archaeon]|nr:hypothetical protein [Candidatus Bathyarchaeota archaeon]